MSEVKRNKYYVFFGKTLYLLGITLLVGYLFGGIMLLTTHDDRLIRMASTGVFWLLPFFAMAAIAEWRWEYKREKENLLTEVVYSPQDYQSPNAPRMGETWIATKAKDDEPKAQS